MSEKPKTRFGMPLNEHGWPLDNGVPISIDRIRILDACESRDKAWAAGTERNKNLTPAQWLERNRETERLYWSLPL